MFGLSRLPFVVPTDAGRYPQFGQADLSKTETDTEAPLHQVQLLVVFGLLRNYLNRNATNETKPNTDICYSIFVSANTFGGICFKQAEAHFCDCRYHPIWTGRFIQDPTREAHNDAISTHLCNEYTRLNSRSSRRTICGVHFRFCKLFYRLRWLCFLLDESFLRQK